MKMRDSFMKKGMKKKAAKKKAAKIYKKKNPGFDFSSYEKKRK